jgi:type II secretory pathway pseudopilin PulG
MTLVELLTAMTILLILAALALPMMEKWSESGREAQCANRARTLGQAVLLYAADHQMTLPGENISKSAAPRMTTIYQYAMLILPYLGLTLEQARAAPHYFRCPSRTNGTVDLPNYIFSGANELSPAQLGVAGVRLKSMGQPSRTVLLGEAGAAVPFSNHPFTTQAPRPDAKVVLFFVDGHMGFLPIYSGGGGGFTTKENPPPGYGYQWSANLD